MSEQILKFTDLNIQESKFLLSILYENGLWHYNFAHTINKNIYILLMKSFRDEDKFLEEINSIKNIFDCSVITENYDLKGEKSVRQNKKQKYYGSELMSMDISLYRLNEHLKANPVDVSKFDLPKEEKEKIEKFIENFPKPARRDNGEAEKIF